MSGDRATLPPVRLLSDAELARDALTAPLFSRAVRLARWAAGRQIPVGAGGELLAGRLPDARRELGLAAVADGPELTAEAWRLAVDIGLVDIDDTAPDGEGDSAFGTALPGAELALLTRGSPAEALAIWRDGVETVLADAAAPSLEELLGAWETTADGAEQGGSRAHSWERKEETAFLEGALDTLYRLTVTDSAVSAGAMVPLPVLAASFVVPDGMEEPTDAALEKVSAAMMTLDDQFRALEPTGLVAYRPVDEALIAESDPADAGPTGTDRSEPSDEEDVARYGMVRLTPLGLYGVRGRLLDAGMAAPVVGDLTDQGADALLEALPGHTVDAAQSEVELWFAARGAEAAAREVLRAARGDDERAPLRRLHCQQALSVVGAEAEPALREVLDDRQLGGLARVWLAEHGAVDVPPPAEDMVFWLTVDTLAAQFASTAARDSAELRDLVRGLVDQHTGFFDKAWRVEHPGVGEVLEVMGRLHPDRAVAKEARKAAFKARSRMATEHGGG